MAATLLVLLFQQLILHILTSRPREARPRAIIIIYTQEGWHSHCNFLGFSNTARGQLRMGMI
jgi:hypothetical protein